MRKIIGNVTVTLSKQIILTAEVAIDEDSPDIHAAVERIKMSINNKFGQEVTDFTIDSVELDGKKYHRWKDYMYD